MQRERGQVLRKGGPNHQVYNILGWQGNTELQLVPGESWRHSYYCEKTKQYSTTELIDIAKGGSDRLELDITVTGLITPCVSG